MAYIGETDTFLGAAATQARTNAYTPAGSTSLIALIYGTYNSLPWASYGGGGSPGDGVNSWTLIGQAWDTGGAANFVLAAAPAVGATSVALNVGYTGATGNAVIVFNSGEARAVHLTNGSTAVPDTGTFTALTGVNSLGQNVTFNSTALISGNPNVIGVYQALGVSNAAVQFGASSSSAQLNAAALFEYSGLSACAGFNFNHNGPPGTGANGVVGGNVTFTQGGVLLGFGLDLQSNSALTAGTSPLAFASRSVVWSSVARGVQALLEDVAVTSGNSPAQSTFKGGNQFDSYNAFSAFFPTSSNASATPSAGSASVSGNAPTNVRGTVITPQVASGLRPGHGAQINARGQIVYQTRDLLVPSRKIFLPSRTVLRPHV